MLRFILGDSTISHEKDVIIHANRRTLRYVQLTVEITFHWPPSRETYGSSIGVSEMQIHLSSQGLCPSAHETHEKRAHDDMQASVDPTATTKNLPTIIAEEVLGQELDERLKCEQP